MPTQNNSPSKQSIARLKRTKGFVLDLDGTLVLGDSKNHGIRALPLAHEFIAHLRKRNIPLVALTNGTIRTPANIAEELKSAGFDLSPDEILTPATVAADYLARKKFKTVMVMGHEGASRPLEERGLKIVAPDKGRSADAIFIAWFREVNMGHIEAACDAVNAGAKPYVASVAPYFATAGGKTLGTSCAIAGGIHWITGVRAKVLGKPAREALALAARRMNLRAQDLAVVGDDPHLEIPMALSSGALAVGVATGISGVDQFAAVPKAKRADIVAPGIGDVLRLLQRG